MFAGKSCSKSSTSLYRKYWASEVCGQMEQPNVTAGVFSEYWSKFLKCWLVLYCFTNESFIIIYIRDSMLLGFYAKMNDLGFIRMDSTMMQLFQNQDSEKCWDAIRVCLWSTNKWELAVMKSHTNG